MDEDLENCQSKLAVMLQRINALEQWIVVDCFCPCCRELEKCLEECTFAEDAPEAAEKMMEARKVMWEGK